MGAYSVIARVTKFGDWLLIWRIFQGYKRLSVIKKATHQLSSSLTNMATIKIFQSVQTTFQTLGLYSPRSHRIHSFNLRILYFSLFPFLIFLTMLGFLFFEATTMEVFLLKFLPIFFIFFNLLNEIIQKSGVWEVLLRFGCIGMYFH